MSGAYWGWAVLYVMTPVVGLGIGRKYSSRKQEPLAKLFEEQTLLFSIGFVLVLTVFWPLVLVSFALDPWISKIGYWLQRRRHRFHCQRKHLSGSVTVEVAEASAKVVDPLHRAPDLPFGHLNPAWHVFLKQRKFGYRLQSFRIPGIPLVLPAEFPDYSVPLRRKVGYAWVGLWEIKAEFIHEWN
jgi:hypothetical protein